MTKKEKIETLWREIEKLRAELEEDFYEFRDYDDTKYVASGEFDNKSELVDHIMDKVNKIVRIAEPKI